MNGKFSEITKRNSDIENQKKRFRFQHEKMSTTIKQLGENIKTDLE